MPTYKVRCRKCNKVFEAVARIAERNKIKCECGGDITIVISLPFVSIFKPDWYEHIAENPIYITSKKQLRQECESRGMIAKALD